jgi:hypothetical protein
MSLSVRTKRPDAGLGRDALSPQPHDVLSITPMGDLVRAITGSDPGGRISNRFDKGASRNHSVIE